MAERKCPVCLHRVGAHDLVGCAICECTAAEGVAEAHVLPMSWESFACLACGTRRFDAFECCGVPAAPVTVTVARRVVAP